MVRNFFLLVILSTILTNMLLADEYSYEYEQSRMERFIDNFYSNNDFTINHPTIGVKAGLSFPDFNQSIDYQNLSNTYNVELIYGFTRINDRVDIPGVFAHQGEYVFLGNITPDFKTFDVNTSGNNTDTWRFGAGLRDGYGFEISNDYRFYLNHATGFVWHHVDFEFPGSNPQEQKIISDYDENLKLGIFHNGGFKFEITAPLLFNIDFQRSIVFDDTNYWGFFGAWIFDNITQRWIDYYEPEMIEKFGRSWPWMKFAYKNLLSLAVYSFRQYQAHWPFTSQAAMSFTSFTFGMTFIFE